MQFPLLDEVTPLTPEFAKLADRVLSDWKVPGLAIAVIDNGNVWAEGYGMATLPDTPVTPQTNFYCASTTKAFTAAALALMIESGNYSSLSWTTSISSLIRDDFVLEDGWATTHLTLEDALSHRTGLPRHDKSSARVYNGHPATIRDVVRSLRHLPMTAEPRVKFQYCNLMFVVVSHVIETLTGRWLGHVLREWIWEPLGMNHTYFSRDDAERSDADFASGYYYDDASGVFENVPHMPLQEVSGAGSVISNVMDYARWAGFLLDKKAPLSKKGHEALTTPRMIATGLGDGPFDAASLYALGWVTASYRGHCLITHSGGMDAYGAEVYLFPDLRYGIITLGNTPVTSNAAGEILLWHLADEKLKVAKKDRFDWNAKWRKSMNESLSAIENAEDYLYPDRAQPPLPPSVPVDELVGTYYHPAYQNFTLFIVDEPMVSTGVKKLRAIKSNSTWPMTFDFWHITSDYWAVYMEGIYVKAKYMSDIARVRFDIGSDGTPRSMGIDWRETEDDRHDALVWFAKIE